MKNFIAALLIVLIALASRAETYSVVSHRLNIELTGNGDGRHCPAHQTAHQVVDLLSEAHNLALNVARKGQRR